MTASVTIAHISDIHFGGYADLAQIEALEKFLPTLGAGATVISGDLSQRARHGEFQAAHAFVERLRWAMPVLVIPGNHDIEWWRSPSGLRSEEHTSELQSHSHLVCRLLLEKKKTNHDNTRSRHQVNITVSAR